VFPAQAGTRLQDISPRMNAAYDISGNGKTAVKVNVSKYLVAQDSNQQPLGPGMGSPINRLALSTTRSWNDANRNFVPDCDLLNLAANGECAAAANQNFGSPVFSTRFDPAVQRGFGVRPYDWNFDVSIQHELVPRVAVNVGYFRRWFGNFLVTANQATSAADYTLFNLPLPADSRLPTSGVVNGIANVNPAKFGLVDNLVTAASNYGNQINHWNGFDFAVNARLSDVLLQGGISTGRQSIDNCQVVARLPSITPTGTPATTITPQQYCHVDGKFLTQVKLLGSYTVPRIDVRLAATLQNIPGEETQAAYNAPNAIVAPLLGRNLSGGVANVTINLLPPQTFYEARVNQLDFRAAKIVTFAGKRMQIALDLFNALNSNVVETYNNSYNPTGSWQTPTLILPARVAKITAQFDF
jgi:hypothetical protein